MSALSLIKNCLGGLDKRTLIKFATSLNVAINENTAIKIEKYVKKLINIILLFLNLKFHLLILVIKLSILELLF